MPFSAAVTQCPSPHTHVVLLSISVFNLDVTPQSRMAITPAPTEEGRRHKMLSWRCFDCCNKNFIAGLPDPSLFTWLPEL
ncbi:hypothetical protein CEXT_167521 [Caerostris extrusa]|uniref:Secreted protein n=1 Tax=Caerostris extrusa TaxID=172846 RepID=A0AAV4SC09_CAEEX|nr:hypothetical protein CEXT_167521 [Caerostris extrusa]